MRSRSYGLIAAPRQLVLGLTSFLVIEVICQTCTDSRSEFGFYLTGHSVRSFQVDRLSRCLIACNNDPTCQSVNINRFSKMCDFNNETKHSRPGNFLANEAYVYANNLDRGKSNFCSVSLSFIMTHYGSHQSIYPFILSAR